MFHPLGLALVFFTQRDKEEENNHQGHTTRGIAIQPRASHYETRDCVSKKERGAEVTQNGKQMELPVAVHTRSSWRLPFPSVPDTRTSRRTHAHTRAHIPTRDVVQHRQHRHRRQSLAELSFCGPLYTLTSDLLLHSFPSWNIVEREKNGGGGKEVEQSIEHFKTRRHAEFQFRFLPGGRRPLQADGLPR